MVALIVSLSPIASAGDELPVAPAEKPASEVLPSEPAVNSPMSPSLFTEPSDPWLVAPLPPRRPATLPPPEPLFVPVQPLAAQEPFSLGGQLVERNLAFGSTALDVTARGARPRRRAGGVRGDRSPIRIGPVDLAASLTVSGMSESGGRSSSGDGGWSFSTAVSPSIEGQIGVQEVGRYVSFGYDVSRIFGGDEERDGNFDQSLSVEAHYDFARLKLGLLGDYQSSTGPDRDTGGSAERNTTNVSFTASLPLSLKTSVSAELEFTSNQYAEGISSENYSAAFFANRQLSIKSNVGLGVTLGKLDVQDAPGQTFQQINLRGSFAPTQKLSLSGMIGLEFRQTEDKDLVRPVFELSAVYALRPQTQFGLEASRGSSSSAATSGSNFESTTVSFSVSQQIGTRIRANLSVGMQSSAYETVSGTGDDEREDFYFYVQPRVSYRLNEHFTVSVFYSYTRNDSDQAGFDQQQVGLNATYLF